MTFYLYFSKGSYLDSTPKSLEKVKVFRDNATETEEIPMQHVRYPSHPVARPNAGEWYTWLGIPSSWFAPTSGPSAQAPKATPKPGEPGGPPTPDGRPVAKGTAAYAAILAELDRKYGKYPANAVGYRDSVGDGNYVYRQYSDGRLFIQVSGQGSAPVKPKIVSEVKETATTGGGVPPWVLPVSIVGGAALIGAGIYYWPKIRGKKSKKNPIDIDMDLGPIRLGSNRTYRRYDKYDVMRDEDNRRRRQEWWGKKSDGEKQLWVGGGFALAGLVVWALVKSKKPAQP